MRKTAAVLGLVAMVSLFSASEVRAGAGGDIPEKTVGPAWTIHVVTVLTGPNKGLTAVRVQKGNFTEAALFDSPYVSAFNSISANCVKTGFTLQSGTENRFLGLVSSTLITDVDLTTPGVLTALFGGLGTPSKAAITDIDSPECTTPVGGDDVLSFTATGQFAP